MEFSIQQKDLLVEVDLLLSIARERSIIPIYSYILLSVGADGLRLSACDDGLRLSGAASAVEIKEPGAVAVPGKKFRDVLALYSGIVRLKSTDKHWVTLESDASRTRIAGLDPQDWPATENSKASGKIQIPSETLSALITGTLFAAEKSSSGGYQKDSALLTCKGGRLSMKATDGHRLAIMDVKQDGSSNFEIQIHARALSILQKLLGSFSGNAEIGVSERQQSFEIGKRLLIAAAPASMLPDLDRVVPRDNPIVAHINRESLLLAARRASVFASQDRSPKIQISLDGGVAVISGMHHDVGATSSEIPADFLHEPIRFGVNPSYLCEFLERCDAESVRIALKTPDSALDIRPSEPGELGHQYVLMPMTI